MLQHFFLTYSKGFNEKYGRTGSLLQHPFKRINIKDEKYLRNLIIYIHNNPIKHDFCSNIMDYEWTSYFSHLSYKYTRLSRDFVLDLFSDRENYIYLHESINFFDDIGSFLIDLISAFYVTFKNPTDVLKSCNLTFKRPKDFKTSLYLKNI